MKRPGLRSVLLYSSGGSTDACTSKRVTPCPSKKVLKNVHFSKENSCTDCTDVVIKTCVLTKARK